MSQLASATGLARATIGYVIRETGPRGDHYTPNPQTLLRIAHVLDLDPADLLAAIGVPQASIRELADTPADGTLDVGDLDGPDQVLIKRIVDVMRDQEKYKK